MPKKVYWENQTSSDDENLDYLEEYIEVGFLLPNVEFEEFIKKNCGPWVWRNYTKYE